MFSKQTFWVLLLTLGCWAQKALGQTTPEKYTPRLDRVTVFMNGAQVERSQSLTLKAGEQVIVFTGLSPYADTKSMQVKGRGHFTVVGVNHRHVHPDSLQRVADLRNAERAVKEVTDRQATLRAEQEVVAAQLDMVRTNCSTAGRTAVTPLAGIKELNNYYSQELLVLKKRAIAIDEELATLDERLEKRQKTADSIAHLKLKTVTEVEVKVSAPQAGKAEFMLSYYTSNAGWYPTYDIRSMGITQPLQLSYHANVFQQTREDWRDATVTLSSANPVRTNIAPELRPYWLDYGRRPPRYDSETPDNGVSGTVSDESGTPIIGASVTVVGTRLGTVTDMDGHYSITLPRDGKQQLKFNYIGYVQQVKTVDGPTLNVVLKEDNNALQEVVVVGYGTRKSSGRANRKAAEPMLAREAVVEEAARPEPLPESQTIAVSEQKAQFGYEFEIKQPLTLLSNGKTTSTEIGRYQLPATYRYRGIPRADKEAFLVAEATGWQSLSLLEGEANVFFENTFVGKSILDPSQPSDTLHFSLGRDNGIRIQRTKVADRSTRRLLSSSQEQTMTWRITVKNTRSETVNLTIEDQVPVSQNSNITVTINELTGGKLDSERGIVRWPMQLQSGEQRELLLQYTVKYPKSRHLVVE